jgi:hypothetical protein
MINKNVKCGFIVEQQGYGGISTKEKNGKTG